MILKSFFKNLKKDFNNKSFNGFEFNSKKIKKNYIFFAIKGSKFNGNNFINDAIKRGARIIVSNKFICVCRKTFLAYIITYLLTLCIT